MSDCKNDLSICNKGPRIWQIPKGDNRQRLICPDCNYIHYDNPKVVCGAVTTWEDKYLLCKRAIQPRKGFWTITSGFLELNESPQEGAMRESLEEANAKIEIDQMLATYHIKRISFVQLIFRAKLIDPNIKAGEESLEVKLFSWNEIPWQDLAYPTIEWALKAHQSVKDKKEFAPFTNPSGLNEAVSFK